MADRFGVRSSNVTLWMQRLPQRMQKGGGDRWHVFWTFPGGEKHEEQAYSERPTATADLDDIARRNLQHGVTRGWYKAGDLTYQFGEGFDDSGQLRNPKPKAKPCPKGNPCGKAKANPSSAADQARSGKIAEDAARLVAAGKAYPVNERDGTVTIRTNDREFFANVAERFYAAAIAKHGPQPNPRKPKPTRNPSTRYPKGRATRALLSHHFAEYGGDLSAYERTIGHLEEAGYFVIPPDRAWLKAQARTAPKANPRPRRPLFKVRRYK